MKAQTTLTRPISFLVLTGLVLARPAALGAEDGVRPAERLAIVDRSIEYHGGALYHASETTLGLCSKSGCFKIRARLDDKRYEYEVEGKASGKLRRVLWSSDELQRFEDGREVALDPQLAQTSRDWAMARVYFCFLPYRLNDPNVYKEDLGLETWDGRELHKVKVTFTPGSSTDANDEYLYWLDPETGRVEQFAYSYETNKGGLRFRRATNHRRIGGILFFDQENLGLEGHGRRVGEITPALVRDEMRAISVVRLEEIEVRLLR